MGEISGTVLISGAGSGMGQRAATRFAERGLKVAALDINAEGLAQTANGKSNVRTWTVDVTDTKAVASAVAEAESELGPIQTVYNAAAIMPLGKLMEQDVDTIHKIMDINYGGTVNVVKAALPNMLERKNGVFVNFASMSGIIPTLLTGAYNASKFAVVAFTEVLQHENLDSGVQFACVCPPPVATPLLQQGRETAWPKMLEQTEPISADDVLDTIEASLRKGEYLVMPGKQTKLGWRMRRFFPGLIWKQVHQVEGW